MLGRMDDRTTRPASRESFSSRFQILEQAGPIAKEKSNISHNPGTKDIKMALPRLGSSHQSRCVMTINASI